MGASTASATRCGTTFFGPTEKALSPTRLILPVLLAIFAGAAVAGERVEPVTGNVTILGDSAPVAIERPIQLEEVRDPPQPVVYDENAQKAYEKEVDAYADFRSDFKAIDLELSAFAPAIADCAARALIPPGTSAVTTITVASTGKISRVVAKKGADPVLAACVRDLLSTRETSAVLHGKDRSAPYTFRFQAAPSAILSPIDAALGIAGVAFGSPKDELVNRQESAYKSGISHYYRTNDGDAQYAGKRIGIAFSFHPDVGFYAARIRATGDAATFAVREHTSERFGPPRWDGALKCWYWRGEHMLYVFEGARGSDVGQLMILDIDRATKAKVVSFLPGDSQAGELPPGGKLPKVLIDELGDE